MYLTKYMNEHSYKPVIFQIQHEVLDHIYWDFYGVMDHMTHNEVYCQVREKIDLAHHYESFFAIRNEIHERA
jgi:hypothetical protein